MININLLPKFHRISIRWLALTALSIIIIILLHEKCKIILEENQKKIILLKKEIQTIDKELANFPQKNLILMSNTKRAELFFALLKKLPSTIPVGLYLIEISTNKNKLKLTGCAEETTLIAEWVNKLNAAHFNTSLQEIVRNKESDDLPLKFCLWVNF